MASNQQPAQVFDFRGMDMQSTVAGFGNSRVTANNIDVSLATDSASSVHQPGRMRGMVAAFGSSAVDARGNIRVTEPSSASASKTGASTGQNADEITFVVSGVQFTETRSSLAQKASGFEYQFRGGNRFELNGITPEVFQALLNFVHGRADQQEMAKNSSGLLAVSNQFKLNKLKDQCEQFLKLQVNDEWAIALLKLAHENEAFELKVAAHDFINQHPELKNKAEFQQVAHLFQ